MNHNIIRLQRLNLRLRQLSRTAGGQYQSQAETEREQREKRKYGAAGLLVGAGAIAAGKAAASKIGSLNPDGLKRVGDLLKKMPLRGNRVLSGGALASALRNLR
ncbi:MAG: hypothetical protein ACQKBW_08160 [Puniceicoccales bacterium]